MTGIKITKKHKREAIDEVKCVVYILYRLLYVNKYCRIYTSQAVKVHLK